MIRRQAFLLIAAFATAPAAPAKSAPDATILPKSFAGWELQAAAQTSHDPSAADATNPAILKEYGFTDFSLGTYAQQEGRKLTLRAARFADASGAYGAFTYYKQPEMLNEKIGDQASSLNNRVLFYRGNVLVEALFDKLSAMSAAELRELAGMIPLPQGGARNLPSLPTYLPKQGYVKNTAKYINPMRSRVVPQWSTWVRSRKNAVAPSWRSLPVRSPRARLIRCLYRFTTTPT